MKSTFTQRATAIGVAGTLFLGAMAQSFAAPVPGSAASLSKAAAGQVTDVRWRGRGVAAGVATGLIIGGIAAAAAQPRYYGPGPGYYYYEEPVYAAPPPVYYDAPPAYYSGPSGPNGPVRQCWVATDKDRGYGYWRAC